MCSVLKLDTPPPQSSGDLLRSDRTHTHHLSAVAPGHFLPPTTKSLALPTITLCMKPPLNLFSFLRAAGGISTVLLVSLGPAPPPPHEKHCSSTSAQLTDVNLQESGKGRLLPAPPTASGLQMEHGLTSLELKHMGRDTIAGLIAGILQKYTKKEDVSV